MTNTSDSSELLQIIATLEAQRSSLGDSVIDASIAALRRQLADLDASPPDEQRKLVTVLFADLAGFTALSERMDPEDVREVQDAFFAAMTRPIEAYGGSVEKYIGDAVLAVFGVPETHEDDAERAIHAALAMQGALDNLNRRRESEGEETSPLRLRIGIHTGLVVSRVDEDGDFVVTGDPVNLTSRLQSAAEPGTVLVSADTHRLVAHAFETTDQGAIQIKGKVEPVQVYRIAGQAPIPMKLRGVAGLDSPLVGRQAEMATLRVALERLERGVGGIVTVVGEAGIGKSRLVAELRKVAMDRSPVTIHNSSWIEGRCLSFGTTIPYLLWVDLLRSTLGATLDDTPEQVRDRLREWVLGLCPEHFDMVYPYLARLMSLPLEATSLADVAELDGQTLKQRTFRAAELAIACAANRRPLVLVCEDLHWADSSSLELLLHLLALTNHATLLLICVFRQHADHGSWRLREIASRDYRHRHTDVVLEPLSAADSQVLVDNLLHIDALPLGLRSRILSRTEGNPFFVEEVIRTLIELEAIVHDKASGRWLADRYLDEIPIPETLQGVIMARIDRLQADERHVLQLAAVIGRIFSHRVLASISEGESQLDETLLELQRQELIRERARMPELQYIFKHELTREAAYNSTLKGQRPVLHCQVAKTLERLFPDRMDEMAGLLAHHWELAGDIEQAVICLLRAGDCSNMTYALREALDYYDRALVLLRLMGDQNRTARTLLKLGQVHHNAFDFDRAQLAFLEAFKLWGQQVAPAVPPLHALRIQMMEPNNLDPALHNDTQPYPSWLFAGLTRQHPDGDVVPAMARRWEVLDGGLTYVFHLREDVSWSDGTPVTAGDFEYAWKRVLNPATGAPLAPLLFDIVGAEAFHCGQQVDPDQVGVRAEDEYTLVAQLARPTAYFLMLLGHYVTFPVPRHQVETWGAEWTSSEHLISNGPFRLESFRPGVGVTLVRHQRGCGSVQGNIERIECINPINDWRLAWQLYQEDRIDILGAQPSTAEEFQTALVSHPDQYQVRDSLLTWFLIFDDRRPPFNDVHMRRAFAHAIDKDQLVKSIRTLYVPATGGLVPPGIPGHSSGIGLAFNPDLARQLFRDADLLPEEPFLPIRISVPQHHRWTALSLAEQWRLVLGIDTAVMSTQRVVWRGDCRAFVGVWAADVPDPDNFLRVGVALNASHWHNKTYDRLVERGRQLSEQSQRLRLYQEADRLLMESAVIVPLAYGQNHWLVKPWIRYPKGAAYAGEMIDIVIEPH